jgi:hypothetical protein
VSVFRDGGASKKNLMTKEQRKNAHLLFVEAARDLEAESQGTPLSVGQMQQAYPEEYQNARKYVGHWRRLLDSAAASIEQARRLSDLIHSGDEWVSSIPDVQDEISPVNVDVLEHFVTLESNPGAGEWLHSLRNVLEMQPVSILTFLYLVRLERKHRAQKLADKTHIESRRLKEKTIDMWKSGRFKNRNQCAREVFKVFPHVVTYQTIRDWLQGTPDSS